MNLRKEFDAILHQYGHYVLIVRTDRKTTCTCYNPTTGSVSKTCPYCFGLGTIPIIEKHITREKDLNVPETLPYLSTQQLFGEMAIATRGYFFKPEVVIQPHDLIIDVDWNGVQPIYSGRGLYEVSHVDKKRFEFGEFTFQKVYVKDNPIEKEIHSIRIIERAGETNYLVEGGF